MKTPSEFTQEIDDYLISAWPDTPNKEIKRVLLERFEFKKTFQQIRIRCSQALHVSRSPEYLASIRSRAGQAAKAKGYQGRTSKPENYPRISYPAPGVMVHRMVG